VAGQRGQARKRIPRKQVIQPIRGGRQSGKSSVRHEAVCLHRKAPYRLVAKDIGLYLTSGNPQRFNPTLKTTLNGTQAPTLSGAVKFALRPTAETLADLSRPIDPRHLKTRKQGTTTLTICPWNTIARHLPAPYPWLVLGGAERSGGWRCCGGYWSFDHSYR